jgi:hypothetical protein
MKKTLSILCASAMAVSLTACGTTQTDTTPDYAYATVTGQVTAIDGNSVTLQLGTLSATSGDGQTPPDAAQGDSTSDNSADTQTAPEKPDGDSNSDSSSDTQTPPEKPDGDSSSDTSDSDSGDSTQPEMPSGNGGDMGSAPGGMGGGQSFTSGDVSITVDLSDATITMNSDSATVSDLSTDDVVTLTFDGTGAVTAAEVVNLDGGMGDAPGGMGGGSSTVEQGDSANTISEDSTVSDTTYTSTGDDENALRVDGATVTLSGITVDKSAGASSNVESGDFYGMNAALLATNGATLTIEDATITSSAQNGNGVFSYGTGTTVNISNSTITTTADNSGGIQTTGGGTTNATNLTVDTSGNSAAAIRSDRGGGTVNVNEGTYTSNGYNSPAVYSTAAITVKNATLTANNSEALVIEGQNSITLENCDVTGNMSDTNGTSSDENVHNVMIYQSMSGDAEVGTSSFSMTGGTLTSKNGDMFFITNTDCTLYLSGVSITNEDSDGNLMTITGNSASRGWGTAGKNGAQVNFTADNQVLSGNIVVDTISTLDMTLTNGSNFTGTINITDNDEGGTAVDNNAVVTIDSGCTWTLTGDCTITSLTNNGTINFNGYTITLADGTVLS